MEGALVLNQIHAELVNIFQQDLFVADRDIHDDDELITDRAWIRRTSRWRWLSLRNGSVWWSGSEASSSAPPSATLLTSFRAPAATAIMAISRNRRGRRLGASSTGAQPVGNSFVVSLDNQPSVRPERDVSSQNDDKGMFS